MMKHTFKITLIMIVLFLLSQFIGLILLNKSIDTAATLATGNVTFNRLPYDIDRPELDEGTSFVFILVAVIVGTLIVLLIIKFKKPKIWKVWYMLSIVATLAVALSVFINEILAFAIAIIVGILKVYKPSTILHNASEIFIYSGIALIFVPVMNIFSAFMLLIFISIYDAYAVWKSKHMVTMANFLTDTKVFAGLSIPYGADKNKKTKTKSESEVIKKNADDKNNISYTVSVNNVDQKTLKTAEKSSKEKGPLTAVLGGGDMAFPLLFSGVVLKAFGLLDAYIVSVFAGAALLVLLLMSQKGKFYPAMPFISAGCFIGYLAILVFRF